MTTLLKSALDYAERGFHVIPLRPGSKIPLTPNGHLNATDDLAVIQEWWSVTPTANIGIALAPSGLVVLDVDVGEGKAGYEALNSLHELVPLPPTLTAHTPSGGLHAVYSRPEGCPAERKIDFLELVEEGAGKGSGLDLLGDGYIVAAPSVVKGKAYRWVSADDVVDLPLGLVGVFAANRTVEAKTVEEAEAITIAHGGRDNALFRLGCALRDTGLSGEALHQALMSENAKRCKPPMADHEVARVVTSVMGRVTPSRDVLVDVAIVDSIVPNTISGLKAAEGRISFALEEVHADPVPAVVTYSTGFKGLDECLGGGWPTRCLSTIIGPPSAGKSAFAMGQCLQMSVPTLYISTELASHEIKDRVAAQIMGVPWGDVMQGNADADEVGRVVSGHNMRICGADHLPGDTLTDRLKAIRDEIHAYKDEVGICPVVFIDYLQDMARGEEDRDPVGRATGILRRMAIYYDCAMVVLSSTSRQWYNTRLDIEHAVGFLAAAKESGGVDYDSANLIYLDAGPNDGGCKQVRIAVAKARHGVSDFVGAEFQGIRGGRWESKPEALAAFTKEHKVEKALGEQMQADNQAVIQRIRDKGPDPISVLQHNCGIPMTRAKAAILRLQADGTLERRKLTRYDNEHRAKTVEVVAFPEVKPPGEESAPESPKHALSFLDAYKGD